MALLTRSREAPTMPASSSWVTGRTNSSAPSESSSRRLAVRPVTSRKTESAIASSIAAQPPRRHLATPQSSSGLAFSISSTGS